MPPCATTHPPAQVPLEPFAFGQAVVAYHQQEAMAAEQMSGRPELVASAGDVQDGISLQEAAAAAAAGPAGAGGAGEERARTSGRLRVLFVKRGGEGRQLLNAGELLQACNAWRWLPPNSSQSVSAECREVGAWGCVGLMLSLRRGAWGGAGVVTRQPWRGKLPVAPALTICPA